MPTQSELIGNHPSSNHIFGKWLACNDISVTVTKNHRSLTPLVMTDNNELIEWFGREIFKHHHAGDRVERLKRRYSEIGFSEYAKQHYRLPKVDKVKKGNATEILLIEYIQQSLNKILYHAYKLRYNPNVDQAIKGDDTLMIDIIKEEGKKDRVKVYLGEAKFRGIPTKDVILDIATSLSKDKKPLSYTFLVDELCKHDATKEVADLLDNFIIDEVKGKGDLVYTGLLLSNDKTLNCVETHLNCDNPDMVLISIGINNPGFLIEEAFKKAEYYYENPNKI